MSGQWWVDLVVMMFSNQRKCGEFGFNSHATAEEVTSGIHAPQLTAIVTGASSGIGFETTRVLALRGVRVVMAVRDVEAGERAKTVILAEIKDAKLIVMNVDVSSMSSVRNFCSAFKSLGIPLNILINNAGMLGGPFQLSVDGIELNFATNYLGHFLLTKLLLPAMVSTAKESEIEGRIIHVSSHSHYLVSMKDFQLRDLNDKSRYMPFLAYARSKLASILHANEISKELREQNANVTINCVHPGIIVTNIVRNSPFLVLTTYLKKLGWLVVKDIPQGAATQCFLALHPGVKGITGEYFQNCSISKRSNASRDSNSGRKLWEFSEYLVARKNLNLERGMKQQCDCNS